MSAGWQTGAGQARPVVIQPEMYSRGTTVTTVGEPGVNCFGCRICPCIHLGFLCTKEGWLKMTELLLVTICMILLTRYGIDYSEVLGFSFQLFFINASACIMLICVLVFTYLISAKSFGLIRSSVLEVVFNILVSVLYILSSCLLSYTVEQYLHKLYRTQVHFSVYPAMSACYVLGFVLGVVHVIDAFLAFRSSR